MDLVDHLGSIASIVSLPAALITLVAALRRPGPARTTILWIALTIATIAYTVDIGDRLGWIKLSETGDLTQAWGQQDTSLYITVNSRRLTEYKDKFKVMLILEVTYTNIDKMTDTMIDKSIAFTITGEILKIGVPLAPPHLRLQPKPDSKAGDTITVPVLFFLVIIPSNVLSEQITSLTDLERLGGKIITTVGREIIFITGVQAPGGVPLPKTEGEAPR